MPTELAAYVVITSIIGTFHATDVEHTPTTASQWLRGSLTPVTDPVYAFGWAADSALERFDEDRIRRDVWLIQGGVVTDHARIS